MVVNSEREEEARQEIKVEQGRKRVKKKGKTQKSKKKRSDRNRGMHQ